MIDYDVLLGSLGGLGLYQILVFACLGYFAIPAGLNDAAPVFISYTPNYRCEMYPFDDPELYPNLSSKEVWNMTTPLNAAGEPIDACVRYTYNLSNCAGNGDIACVNRSVSTAKCGDHYFDKSVFTNTVVTEFDLVCDWRFLNSLANSMYMLGFLIGATVSGHLSDKYGRRRTITASGWLMVLTMLAVSFSNSVGLYIVCRFFVATFTIGAHVAVFTHIMELTGNKWRTLVGMGYRICFALGYMTWSVIAYIVRDWRQMQLGAFFLGVPFVIAVAFVPESPRWLFANAHDNRGKKVVSAIEKLNKVNISDDEWRAAANSRKISATTKDAAHSVLDLFRFDGLRIVTLKVGFNWFVNSMLYYGILLNTASLAEDIFLSNVYACSLEIATYVVCIVIMDRIGRRVLLSVCLTGAGLTLLASTVAKENASNDQVVVMLGLVLALIAKSFASGAYAVIYNFVSELYPTEVRSNGIGFGLGCAYIGSILSPFVISLQDYISWAPSIILGIFAVVAGLLSLTFQDTTGRNMMETIDEAEVFYAGKEMNIRTISNGRDNDVFRGDDDHTVTAA